MEFINRSKLLLKSFQLQQKLERTDLEERLSEKLEDIRKDLGVDGGLTPQKSKLTILESNHRHLPRSLSASKN